MRDVDLGSRNSKIYTVMTSPVDVFRARWRGYPVSTVRRITGKQIDEFCEDCDNQGCEDNICIIDLKYGTREDNQAARVAVKSCKYALVNGVEGTRSGKEFIPLFKLNKS
jgi:hypothetical protein